MSGSLLLSYRLYNLCMISYENDFPFKVVLPVYMILSLWLLELTQFPRTAKSHGQYQQLRSSETEPRSGEGFMVQSAQVHSSVKWVDDDCSVRAI